MSLIEPIYSLATAIDLICRSDQEAKKLTAQRIQNWVKAGLVRPLPQKMRGRGVHRRFDHHEILKIVSLLELLNFAMPWSVLELVAGIFDDARAPGSVLSPILDPTRMHSEPSTRRRSRQLFSKAVNGETDLYLRIIPQGLAPLEVEFGPNAVIPKDAIGALFLNLKEIFKRYRQGKLIDSTAADAT